MDHAIDCVYILLDAADTASLATALECRARLVNGRLTLEAGLEESPESQAMAATAGVVRPAVERDVEAMRRIAAVSHRPTRFYADPRFDRDRVDLLYQTWIENSCHGYADRVFAFETRGEVAGYVTCHLGDGITGRIGLIAVRNDLRGCGAGVSLLRAARDWFVAAKCRSWTVVTQASNIPASRLYRAAGFLPSALQTWFHLWPDEAARGRP